VTELLEFAELRHFLLGFADRRRRGQGLRDSFAIDLIGEPEIGAVTWLTRSMAATTWFTTPTRGAADATGTKVAELSDSSSKALTLLL
jgi:hypothetical protein